MFAKVYFLVLAAQVALAALPDEVPGTLQAFSTLFLPAAAADFQCDGGYGSACTTCNVMKQCLGKLPAFDTDCSASTLTPYCNGGQCSAMPDIEANCPGKEIACTGEGIFPDPTTCQLYHYCSSGTVLSDVYICPAGYVFNAATGLCKRSYSSSDCITVKCPVSTGLGTYGTSKVYFAACLYTGASVSEIKMFKCSDGTSFDGKDCKYQCTKEGNFADSNDETKYYQCYLSSGKYVADYKSCTNGKKFDATRQLCVL